MLVLSRKLGEAIVIGDGIVLTVLSVRGGQVRLGIDAPRTTPVWREELLREDLGATREVSKPAPATSPR